MAPTPGPGAPLRAERLQRLPAEEGPAPGGLTAEEALAIGEANNFRAQPSVAMSFSNDDFAGQAPPAPAAEAPPMPAEVAALQEALFPPPRRPLARGAL